jgi:hypothetical protein
LYCSWRRRRQASSGEANSLLSAMPAAVLRLLGTRCDGVLPAS